VDSVNIGTVAVQVHLVPGNTQAVSVPENASVRQAITAAGFDVSGYQVRMDGETVNDLDTTTVERGADITLVRQVKGS